MLKKIVLSFLLLVSFQALSKTDNGIELTVSHLVAVSPAKDVKENSQQEDFLGTLIAAVFFAIGVGAFIVVINKNSN